MKRAHQRTPDRLGCLRRCMEGWGWRCLYVRSIGSCRGLRLTRADFIGTGVSLLLKEFKLDGSFTRFALVVTTPFWVCVSFVRLLPRVLACLSTLAVVFRTIGHIKHHARPRPRRAVPRKLKILLRHQTRTKPRSRQRAPAHHDRATGVQRVSRASHVRPLLPSHPHSF
jgi:hypothetical protein